MRTQEYMEPLRRRRMLETAMRAVLSNVPNLSLDQSLVAYRQTLDYTDKSLEDRALLIVELDKMRHANPEALLNAYCHDESIVDACRPVPFKSGVIKRHHESP